MEVILPRWPNPQQLRFPKTDVVRGNRSYMKAVGSWDFCNKVSHGPIFLCHLIILTFPRLWNLERLFIRYFLMVIVSCILALREKPVLIGTIYQNPYSGLEILILNLIYEAMNMILYICLRLWHNIFFLYYPDIILVVHYGSHFRHLILYYFFQSAIVACHHPRLLFLWSIIIPSYVYHTELNCKVIGSGPCFYVLYRLAFFFCYYCTMLKICTSS